MVRGMLLPFQDVMWPCPPQPPQPVQSGMGWFSRSKPEQASAATRQDRQKCWENRDLYFGCLDRAGVLKAGDEGNVCAKEKSRYEENCAKSWVRRLCLHFVVIHHSEVLPD